MGDYVLRTKPLFLLRQFEFSRAFLLCCTRVHFWPLIGQKNKTKQTLIGWETKLSIRVHCPGFGNFCHACFFVGGRGDMVNSWYCRDFWGDVEAWLLFFDDGGSFHVTFDKEVWPWHFWRKLQFVFWLLTGWRKKKGLRCLNFSNSPCLKMKAMWANALFSTWR